MQGKKPLLWIKRIAVYLIGLYLMAMGVVFSAKSGLGVSPVGSLANVLYNIGLDSGAPSFVTLGNCTTAVYCLYILAELLILRRDFRLSMLLQLPASLLFGQLVNLAGMMLAFLPAPGAYAARMGCLLCSIPLVAAGVMLYLTPDILPTPGEGMSLAIAKRTGLSVGSAKTIFDCSMVVVSAAVSLIYFRRLVGIREGTVICALLVGFVMKQLQKPFLKPLLRFVGRESKVDRALAAAGGYLTDSSGRPKVIVTIGREFGSGGREIGELLAKKLGIAFYDRRIDELASERSGLPMGKVEELESRMERAVVRDFMNAAYDMTNGALSPDEELFVAQAAVIREIAASGESCVILGRCADYVLYDDPNCFRIFIHARPDARIKRVMAMYGVDAEEARRETENTDRARASRYKRFTGREYGRQEYYHLGVDSGMLGTEESVAVITEALKRWCEVRGTHPLSFGE
ncbi:MAG: cytidylate kinase family protein [Oscillospiraceae bacterium]|nr:cytidylate kinase family protein [Oscillospiraceae bacterium]